MVSCCSLRRLLVYFRILVFVALFAVWLLAPSSGVVNRRLASVNGTDAGAPFSLREAIFRVQAWHVTLLILGFFSLLVVAACCWKSPTQPPKYDQIFLSGFNLTDISTDIFVAVQSFQVNFLLGMTSTLHLVSVFFVNLILIRSFLMSLRRKEPTYWTETLRKGSNTIFKFILLISAFGPSFMKILTSKLFGNQIFCLDGEKYINEYAALNWGICYEGFVQMGFAIMQLYLGWSELSEMKKINVFLSLGTSLVMLLLALLEALFVSDAEDADLRVGAQALPAWQQLSTDDAIISQGGDLQVDAQAPTSAASRPQLLAALELLRRTPLSCLLIFVVVGIVAGLQNWPDLPTFACNLLAIVPLADFIGVFTEALAFHSGNVLGVLLNATFGSVVQIIVATYAIKAGLVTIVHSWLIGWMLFNLMLMLGVAFAVGSRAPVGPHKTQTSQHLVLSSLALALPTVLARVIQSTGTQVLLLSRFWACVMMFAYAMYIAYQFRLHAELFAEEEEEEESEEVSAPVAATGLFACTCAVAYCSEFLVGSIEGVSKGYGLPEVFIGTILLPVAGSFGQGCTALRYARSVGLDMALGIATGTHVQMALYVVPLSVIIGWIINVAITPDFGIFLATVLLLSTFICWALVNYVEDHRITSTMLIFIYVAVAVSTWFIPAEA